MNDTHPTRTTPLATSLDGQVVVVTGASSGIGRATAVALDDAGATVVLVARREHELREIAGSGSGRSVVEAVDVTDETAVGALAARVVAQHGRIDGLVNNAGLGAFAPIVATELAAWRGMFDVNVTGSFLCARAVLPGMIERGDGWIVNVCSDVSRRVFPGGGAYCASKFAQYALSLTLGAECRPHGIRVGAVLPGMVDTPFANGKPEDRLAWILRPADVAEAILFLATRPPGVVVDELTVHPVRQDY